MSALATSAATTGTHEATPHATSTGLSNVKLAVWAFLASECLLFGALISTYLLYRGRSIVGPYPHQIYDIPYTSVSSFVLLMSSLTMVLALSAIQRGDQHRLRLWLLATAALGTTFIGGQIYEFTSFIREGLTVKTNLFGSSFFVLTGFHGVHVTVGIVMLLSLANMSARGKIPQAKAEVVEVRPRFLSSARSFSSARSTRIRAASSLRPRVLPTARRSRRSK